ncbi:hypothetical protein DIPPA_61597 [Diplonema papillatum]|nr:hypothetical protein DIPPA_61597 [Diplonema papillatum]
MHVLATPLKHKHTISPRVTRTELPASAERTSDNVSRRSDTSPVPSNTQHTPPLSLPRPVYIQLSSDLPPPHPSLDGQLETHQRTGLLNPGSDSSTTSKL